MFGITVTDYDKKVYEEKIADFIPDHIIDAHSHVWLPGMKRQKPKGSADWVSKVAPDMSFEDMCETNRLVYPGKKVTPVIMGSPTCYLDKVNAYVSEILKEHNPICLYCTNYDTSEDEILAAMAEGYVGIKPYLANCPPEISAKDVTIYDFLPHAHLELMNRIGGIVMLHIPRAQRLRDPINLRQMLEIDEMYPNAKVIIAHVGRAYVHDDIGNAFEVLKNTKNLYFDFSANVYDYAIERLIDTVGTKRIMYGTDMPYSKMRMYRIDDNGNYVNVVPRGLYGDVSADPHMRESDEPNITTFVYEELLAFRRAAEKLGLTKKDVSDMMYGNAARYFGIEK